MSVLRFVFSRLFLKQVVLVAVLAAGGLVGLYYWMAHLTEHHLVLEVPSYLGVPVSELDAFSDTIALEYVIIDSVYSDEFPKGTVTDQDPLAGTGAKRGRKVYLVVNAVMPQQVKMPDLNNLSFRQARAILETMGLHLGDVSFRPDIAKNAVLDQEVGGSPIRAGQLLFKGSRVDLVLGDGLSSIDVAIPYLLYHQLDTAIHILRSLSLNLGVLVVDTPVVDSTRLRVYRQIPAFEENRNIRGGSTFDLFVTDDSTAISFDMERYRWHWMRDTVGFDMDGLDYEDFE